MANKKMGTSFFQSPNDFTKFHLHQSSRQKQKDPFIENIITGNETRILKDNPHSRNKWFLVGKLQKQHQSQTFKVKKVVLIGR